MPTKAKVPAQVLTRAKALAVNKKPSPPMAPVARPLLPREKVVRALKKLHPMD